MNGFSTPSLSLTVDMVFWTQGVEAALQEIMKGKNAGALKEENEFLTK